MSSPSRMITLFALLGSVALAAGAVPPQPQPQPWPLVARDAPRLELVMQLVVTCATPEKTGGSVQSKDGRREEIWPIIGGRFEGKGIRGTVVPGGGDFPVVRPDGVEVIDALYRLKTDDGVTILIHNVGLSYPGAKPGEERYRLAPQFTAPVGKSTGSTAASSFDPDRSAEGHGARARIRRERSAHPGLSGPVGRRRRAQRGAGRHCSKRARSGPPAPDPRRRRSATPPRGRPASRERCRRRGCADSTRRRSW
ncbi:MAG: DUF3237 domain-containing protein [Steroidobacteraceae bacterium]